MLSILLIAVESHRAKPQVRAVPKQRPLNKAEKDKALSRTKDFTSQYPHFKVVMQRGHLHNRYEFVSFLSKFTIVT